MMNAKYGTKGYFDKLYASSKEPWVISIRASQQYRYKLCLQILRRFSDKYDSALDIGCSQGQFTKMLQDIASKIIAIDISETAIQRAKERYGSKGAIKFELGSLPRLRYADSQFDLVVALEVLYYLEKEERSKALSEIKRILKNDGYFITSARIAKPPYFSYSEIKELVSRELVILNEYPIYGRLHSLIEKRIYRLLDIIDYARRTRFSSSPGIMGKLFGLLLDIAQYPLRKIISSMLLVKTCHRLTRSIMEDKGITQLVIVAKGN
jgi:ubiquinone/menaquinone biosynthesis C-methylase UbiE